MRSMKRKRMLTAILLIAWPAMGQDKPQPPGQTVQTTGTFVRLTMEDAIRRGLQSNLRVLVAEARVEEAGGTVERRFANLLPRVRGEFVASIQNRNLRAFGLSFPGVPTTVPLFSTYDFRVSAEQPILDFQAHRGWKASQKAQDAARQDVQDTRDLIVRTIAALYLNAQSAEARVRAAETRVHTAEALLGLAKEKREVGVATGIDVLRAEVQLANERQRLFESRNSTKQALLVLARNIGMSPGTHFELAEPLKFDAMDAPEAGAAIAAALTNRADYQSLAAQREVIALQQKANDARYLPRVSIGGDYGGIGRSFGEIKGTGTLQGKVSVTLYDRDRKGEEVELAARLKRVEAQMADLRLGIEQEIREALLTMESAAQEVKVAEVGRGLAEKELALARERFEAGVTNNIEITTAQDALSRAMENVILATARYSDAKMGLARALGATEQNFSKYLGGRQPKGLQAEETKMQGAGR